MNWPGHDDAPHFQMSGAEYPRLKRAIDGLWTFALRNRRVVIMSMSAAVIAGLISFGPKIKNSIIRTLERVGQSMELRGRAIANGTQSPVENSISLNFGLSREAK
jgi:adenylosuccinate lyase